MTAAAASRRGRGGRLLSMEMAAWASLYRFLFRRPRVPAGASGFTYHRQMSATLTAFIVLTAIEIPIVDLIVRRWVPVRIAFLVIDIWGLTWMIGFALSRLTRPHAIGPEGIRVRNGMETDIALSWHDVQSVALRKHASQPKTPRVTINQAGRRTLRMQSETNIEIELERPVVVHLRSGEDTIDVVRLWADEPKSFLAQALKRR